ncbi:uncharacterized protein UHOD_11728 [Ustilago sp. UG-2017b]|nr:uncharacterized protein UHOD_11728 [Ustilago sp. UG-2017b]
MSDMTKYCAWHDKWTFGHEQTNGHFEMHIDALLRGYAEQEWCRQTCWFCLVDKGLPAATRAHCFKEPHELVAHSITPLPPPPAAMSSIQSAAQEEINALMAQVVTDAEEQVAGQVGCSVLPILSTGATQEASSANSSRPVLLTGHHSRCGKPLMVCHACPFCAQD